MTTFKRMHDASSEAYIAQRVIWDGLSKARAGKASHSVCATDIDANAAANGDQVRYPDHSGATPKVPPVFAEDTELAEDLAAAAAETVSTLQGQRETARSAASGSRRGVPLLRCLIRIAYVVSATMSDEAVARFRIALKEHSAYRSLQVHFAERQQFEGALMKLSERSGNMRKDLMRIGFAAPSNRVWRGFAAALERRIGQRLGRDAA